MGATFAGEPASKSAGLPYKLPLAPACPAGAIFFAMPDLTPAQKARLDNRVRRARSAIGRGIRYRLGHGGVHVRDELPTRTGYCDCSGFIAWVLGISRVPKPGRQWWLETTNIYRDATSGKRSTFVQIPHPVPGCLVVYPDRKVLGVHREGHIGVVTRVLDGRIWTVDCSASDGGKTKEAIRELDRTRLWTSRKSIYVLLREDFE